MTIKKITVGDAQFQFEASIVNDGGFVISLTEYRDNNQRDVVETYVGISEAKQMVDVLQEAIKFSENQPHVLSDAELK
ncbi:MULTISPECIES: hypothetical protein [unclassified Lysinibacillus]|uniref:hypothetical protein n=1 Tax=unclassified Lysinibacillus TaxID=2636778 RepID=UPI003816D8D8